MWMSGIVVATACAAAMLLVFDRVAPFGEPRSTPAPVVQSACR